jgi:hypothetical protein
MLLNEYEIEFMFREIRNIRNLGNVHIRGPHIVMSRIDAQNRLDFHFTLSCIFMLEITLNKSATGCIQRDYTHADIPTLPILPGVS